MKAMIWICEIESAKSIAELKMSKTIIGAQLQSKFEVLDSKIANGDSKRRVVIEEKAAQKDKRILTERQVDDLRVFQGP